MSQGNLFDDDFNKGLERGADSLGSFDDLSDDDLDLLEAELEAQGGKSFNAGSHIQKDHPLLSGFDSSTGRYNSPTYSTSNYWQGAYKSKGYSNYSYNNYKYQPVKSTSQYLRESSYWGNSYSYTTSSKTLAHEQLHEVLKELNKTINLTSNSLDGQEETLNVKFSNGLQVNDFESNTLFVNPNVMMNGDDPKDGDGYYDALDAMNGQAMLCSFMKKQIHTQANQQYKECVDWSPRNIFATDIQQTAAKEVGEKWPGFNSYISSQMHTFGVSKQVIEKGLQEEMVKLDDIVESLCYNRLSGEKIDYNLLPPNFQAKMEEAEALFNTMMDTTCQPEDRFLKALNIWENIQNLFKDDIPPEPQQPQGGDGQPQGGQGQPQNDDQDQEGDQDQDQPQNGQNQPQQKEVKLDRNASPKDRRFTGDNSYNNHAQVEGDLVFNQLDHNKKLRERLKQLNDALQGTMKEDTELDPDIQYKLVIPPVNQEEITAYDTFVRSNKKAIDCIKNSLMFHNNTATIPNYGLTDGDLDEHALYKMHFGEYERLFERKETLSEKGYHVTLVIDQSGSMGGSKIREASQLCILFSEALKYLRATEHSIYGFETSYMNTWVYKDKLYNKHKALINAESHGGTAMGHHLAAIGDKILVQYPEYKNKFMFVLCDGEPTHRGQTMSPEQFTGHIIKKLRQQGIQTFGIGICNGFNETTGNMIFGEGNHITINNVKDSLPILVNKMRKFLQKSSKV